MKAAHKISTQHTAKRNSKRSTQQAKHTAKQTDRTMLSFIAMIMAASPPNDEGDEPTFRLTLTNAKGNPGYVSWKATKKAREENPDAPLVFKTSPRLKEDDQAVIKHWLEETGVKFEYTPSSNTIVFTIPGQGNDMEFDGTNTGGQFIRSLVTIATLASSSKVHPKDLTVTNPNKGTGLYIQACMYRLGEGETFTVTGGDAYNSKAPNPEEWNVMLSNIKRLTGRDFLVNHNKDTNSTTITRHKDVTTTATATEFPEPLDDHLADNLLMAILMTEKKGSSRVINMTVSHVKSDFHVMAMVALMRRFDFTFEIVKAEVPGNAKEETLNIKITSP